MQSVPRSHVLPSAPLPPSWQCLLFANCSPPLLKGERHVFSQMAGGGGDGRDGDGGLTLTKSSSVAACTWASEPQAPANLRYLPSQRIGFPVSSPFSEFFVAVQVPYPPGVKR